MVAPQKYALPSLYSRMEPKKEYSMEDLMSLWGMSKSTARSYCIKMTESGMVRVSREEKASRGADNKIFYTRVEESLTLPNLFFNIINNRLNKLNTKSASDDWVKDDSIELKTIADICKDLNITNKALEDAMDKASDEDTEEMSIEDAMKVIEIRQRQ